MSVPKPLPLSGIRHAHGRKYRAFGGDWVGCAFARKSWEILQKVKIIYIFRKTFKGVKMARSVGQRGALQSESQEVSPPWTHENADNQRTCHLTPEQTAESGKNPKKSPKATS